jgi:hypothetical protein
LLSGAASLAQSSARRFCTERSAFALFDMKSTVECVRYTACSCQVNRMRLIMLNDRMHARMHAGSVYLTQSLVM